ncbi:unnamed protein product, partial [Phaeothamnion confervicola]
LKPGRLTVTCVDASNVLKRAVPGVPPNLDVYLKLTLGRQAGAASGKTRVQRRCGASPDFGGEQIRFDLTAPQECVVADDVTLTVELWEDTAWSDELLGRATTSVVRWMAAGTPQEAVVGEVQLRFCYEEAVVGMAVVMLCEGRGLGNPVTAPRPRPYVSLALGADAGGTPSGGGGTTAAGGSAAAGTTAGGGGGYRKRGATVYENGAAPHFNGEELTLWVDAANWTHDLTVEIFSEDVAADVPLGRAVLSLLPYMMAAARLSREEEIPLLGQADGKPTSGVLVARISFFPAGRLTIHCFAGRSLPAAAGVVAAADSGAAAGAGSGGGGRQDPYVVLKAEGEALDAVRKTKVHKDGGSEPSWKEVLQMDVVDHHALSVEVFHHDLVDKDRLIGAARHSLLPVFQRGRWEGWVPLAAPGTRGTPQPAGEVRLLLEFEGPHGVAYPQRQPGMDAFDDSMRLGLQSHLQKSGVKSDGGGGDGSDLTAAAAEAAADGGENPAGIGEVGGDDGPPPPPPPPEFNDDEIENAFRFLDLDQNRFIGTAEIRHILICMGERITDEEVDMMISMVDRDGDGQVSFAEFRALVLDPDPSRPEFGSGADDPMGKAGSGSGGGAGGGKDGGTAAQQQEAMDRDAKRWLAEEFVRENDVGMTELQLAVARLRKLPAAQRPGALLNFDTWVEVMGVEPTGQYRKLFRLY